MHSIQDVRAWDVELFAISGLVMVSFRSAIDHVAVADGRFLYSEREVLPACRSRPADRAGRADRRRVQYRERRIAFYRAGLSRLAGLTRTCRPMAATTSYAGRR